MGSEVVAIAVRRLGYIEFDCLRSRGVVDEEPEVKDKMGGAGEAAEKFEPECGAEGLGSGEQLKFGGRAALRGRGDSLRQGKDRRRRVGARSGAAFPSSKVLNTGDGRGIGSRRWRWRGRSGRRG